MLFSTKEKSGSDLFPQYSSMLCIMLWCWMHWLNVALSQTLWHVCWSCWNFVLDDPLLVCGFPYCCIMGFKHCFAIWSWILWCYIFLVKDKYLGMHWFWVAMNYWWNVVKILWKLYGQYFNARKLLPVHVLSILTWKFHVHAGHKYYYNVKTNVSQWEHPNSSQAVVSHNAEIKDSRNASPGNWDDQPSGLTRCMGCGGWGVGLVQHWGYCNHCTR